MEENRDARIEEKKKDLKQQLELINVSLHNATQQLRDGKVVQAAIIADLHTQKDRLQNEIKKFEAPDSSPPILGGVAIGRGGNNETSEDDFGIPSDLRIRRRPYTMSPEAQAQRKAAANSPAVAEALKGNKNAWKTGQHAQGLLRQIFRPCKSTCSQYPCSLVSEGETEPGGMCLDKMMLAQSINSIEKAIQGNVTDFNSEATMHIAGAMDTLRMLREDIANDNSLCKSLKIDKDGNVIGHEVRSNPSLLPYIKLLEVLKLTPSDFMLTPKELIKQKTEDETNNNMAGWMSMAARHLSGKPLALPGEDNDEHN